MRWRSGRCRRNSSLQQHFVEGIFKLEGIFIVEGRDSLFSMDGFALDSLLCVGCAASLSLILNTTQSVNNSAPTSVPPPSGVELAAGAMAEWEPHAMAECGDQQPAATFRSRSHPDIDINSQKKQLCLP